MPFYLEYTVNQHANIRSSVDGADVEEALSGAADAVREAGCRTALLRFVPTPRTSFGHGAVVARYSETDGWEAP